MEHHFNVEVAQQYGVNEAILLDNIAFWIRKNKANKKHFHEDRYWTYNSSEAFSELFPYWSTDQIDRIIKKCVAAGLLIISNFNDTKYNRTRWYGLTDKGLELFSMSIPRKRGMKAAKSKSPFRENAEYIKEADSKPDIKPDSADESVDKSEKSKKSRGTLSFLSDDFFPNEKGLDALNKHCVRVGMSSHELMDKFFKIHRDKHQTKSNNWQKKFVEFCEAELPKKQYEDKNGKKRRYDGKPLY